jgi:hypothetical protein
VDIVLALPTNHASCTTGNDSGTLIAPNASNASSTPIVQIAKAYAKFLKENFLRVQGVAVGVIPYSAKISVPPDRSAWTIAIPPMDRLPSKPYLKQAVAYGTDGHEGGRIVSNSTQYDWGDTDGAADTDSAADPNVGFPIMLRKGYGACNTTNDKYSLYREVKYHCGVYSEYNPPLNLVATENPASGGANDFRFQRMNLRPCYLGHCNLLANCCEKNCPAYLANPYFITELTDDVRGVIYDLGLIRPINDPRNKSNFLFLAVQWAQMLLFETWTAHPAVAVANGQKLAHPARNTKKKAIIFVVNAPDRFEPQELTYLGFNNDASEIPMQESDAIPFSEGYSVGTKEAIRYTGAGTYDAAKKEFVVNSGSGRLTFSQKGMLKIVVAANPSSIEFFNDNGVEDNVGLHQVTYPTSFTFSGPTNMINWTHNSKDLSGNAITGGKNFGHNLSLYKVKYKLTNATISSTTTLSNQILRCYACYGYGSSGVKGIITNDDHMGSVTDSAAEQYLDPCICTNEFSSGGTFYNRADGWIWGSKASPAFAQIKAYNFFVTCYGLTKNAKFLMTASGSVDQFDPADPVNPYISMEPASGKWQTITRIVAGNKYNVANLSGYTPKNSDRITIFTGRFGLPYTCTKKRWNCTKKRWKCTEKGEYVGYLYLGCGILGMQHCPCPEGYSNAKEETTYKKCTKNFTRDPYYSTSNQNENSCSICCRHGNLKGDDYSECFVSCEAADETNVKQCSNVTTLDGYAMSCSQENDITYSSTTNQTASCNSEKYNVSCSANTYRYDLNNFFFVNLGTKSYNSTAALSNILKNECVGSLQKDNFDWLCFCGDGQLSLTVDPTPGSCKFTNINNVSYSVEFGDANVESSVTVDTSYTILGTRTFYLTPDQIKDRDADGNYYINFDLSGIRIISAEITNRPTETVASTLQMYEGTTQKTSIDCATSDASNTSKTITFKLNSKAPFTVQAKVPYAWIGTVDFRQKSENATIYSNDNTHSFKINIAVPTSTDIVSISPNSTIGKTANNTSVIVTAKRKLSSFTLSGNYNYVKQERWDRSYTIWNGSRTEYKDEDMTVEFLGGGDDGCSMGTSVCPRCGCSDGCNSWMIRRSWDWGSADSGWVLDKSRSCTYNPLLTSYTYAGYTCGEKTYKTNCISCADKTCTNGFWVKRHQKRTVTCQRKSRGNNIMDAISNNCDAEFCDACPACPNCLETASTSAGTDTCPKYYSNTRSTSNNCDSDYSHNSSQDVSCTDAYTKPVSGLAQGSWGGSFDSYTYTITNVNANVQNLTLNSHTKTQLYSNGSFAGTTKNYGESGVTGNLTATVSENGYYKYTSTATNCQLSGLTRTSTAGRVGNTDVNGQQSASATATVTISPENYTYTLIDKNQYQVTIDCTNVVVSNPVVASGHGTISRYAHPNLLADGVKNVRIVDFGYNDSGKPRKYGSVVFGSDVSGNLRYKEYEGVGPLKYWTTSGDWNHLYRTDGVPGDYFVQLLDYNGNLPGIEWFFLNETTSGNEKTGYGTGMYGNYEGKYLFFGLHRVFLPFGEQEYHADYGARVNLISTGADQKMAFVFGGFTMLINNALLLNGYQAGAGTGEIAPPYPTFNGFVNTPEASVARVTGDTCTKLKAAAGTNTMVYVIKYRSATSTQLDSCGPTGKIKVYSVTSEADLNAKLHEIASDIKSFADYQDPSVGEISP